jgi:hypothetical protein
MPTVPSYGSPDEYSLQQRQQSYLPIRGAWPAAAPPGLRPIGGNVFGGNPFGARAGFSPIALVRLIRRRAGRRILFNEGTLQ